VMIVARAGELAHAQSIIEAGLRLALISMFLCFFNLLPIPPLDGSHVVKNVINMSYETYWKISRYGFLILIIVIQFPVVMKVLETCTLVSLALMARGLGFGSGAG